VGARTDNGNVIGDITLGGTLALIFFGGLFAGLIGSVVWVAVQPWLPKRGVRRAAVAAILAVPIGELFLVDPHNPDFVILQSDFVIVALLLGVVAAFGLVLVLVERVLDRRLRHAGPDPVDYVIGASGLALLGGLFALPGAVGLMFSNQACLCSVAPVPIGVPLTVAGIATIVMWFQRIRGDTGHVRIVMIIGRASVLAAGILGGSILATEIADLPL
jgi:hypothetical protein